MRRVVFVVLGLLEIAVAGVLFVAVVALPTDGQVREPAGKIEAVARHAEDQVDRLRDKVAGLRERQPMVRLVADQMREQTRTLTDALMSQSLDVDTIATVRDALGDVATGLDAAKEHLRPEAAKQLRAALKATGDFLETKVAKGAEEVAGKLDKTVEAIQGDADNLQKLLRQAAPDLNAAREIHAGLGRFEQGLAQMQETLKMPGLPVMRDGFQGLEDALGAGADRVEKLAGYTYPVVRFEGLKPVVDQKAFWPEGGTIAEGMRKAAKGSTAAGKELDKLSKDLPKIRTAVDESRTVIAKTREGLGLALKQQDMLEPLLKRVPEQAARLAEELPKFAADLSRLLREAGQVKEVVALIREGEASLDQAIDGWPRVRTSLGKAAEVLRTTQRQLGVAVDNKDQYEAALKVGAMLAQAFTAALPLFTEQLEADLGQHEESLAELRTQLGEVRETIPAFADGTIRLLTLGRWLLGLVGVIFLVHGLSVAFTPAKA